MPKRNYHVLNVIILNLKKQKEEGSNLLFVDYYFIYFAFFQKRDIVKITNKPFLGEKNMQEIVVIYNNEPRASSQLIAQGFGRKHKVVLNLIAKYKKNLEIFGVLPFEKEKPWIAKKQGKSKGGRPVKNYLLNEQQATFLITLFANTPLVLEFKTKLVSEFYKQKRLLRQVQSITNLQNGCKNESKAKKGGWKKQTQSKNLLLMLKAKAAKMQIGTTMFLPVCKTEPCLS